MGERLPSAASHGEPSRACDRTGRRERLWAGWREQVSGSMEGTRPTSAADAVVGEEDGEEVADEAGLEAMAPPGVVLPVVELDVKIPADSVRPAEHSEAAMLPIRRARRQMQHGPHGLVRPRPARAACEAAQKASLGMSVRCPARPSARAVPGPWVPIRVGGSACTLHRCACC